MNEDVKKQLIKSGEALTKCAVEEAFAIAECAIKNDGNALDDTILLAFPTIKQFVLEQCDKISE